MKNIPYGSHYIDDQDIQDVANALKQPFLTQGDTVPKFERSISKLCGSLYSVASNSATSSLHLACLSLNLKPKDLVWVSAMSFVASANCARYCGSDIDFIDINLDDFNICCDALEEKINKAIKIKKLPKVIIVVHIAGYSADMKRISELCRPYNIKIIEDASHALGSSYDKKMVGSCSYSDISVFSFHPVKMITTIEGGVATTNDFELSERMKLLRSHGIERNPLKFSQKPLGPIFYEQTELGFNYRLNDVQAALGLSQLKKLPGFIKKRNEIAAHYFDELDNSFFKLPRYKLNSTISYHLFILRCHNKIKRDNAITFLKNSGIYCNIHYIPIYRHKYYSELREYKPIDYKNTETYYETAFSIPIFFSFDESQRKYTIEKLNEFSAKYS